jgi:hypothetical protein
MIIDRREMRKKISSILSMLMANFVIKEDNNSSMMTNENESSILNIKAVSNNNKQE